MATTAIADSHPAGSRIGRWWTNSAPHGEFWALATTALLFNIGMAVFFFLYNLFMLDFGYREKALGILAGALSFGSMAGTIPMGMIAQRIGTRKMLIVCLLAMAAAFGARLFLLWYPAQMAFAFFDGVMLCGWVVCLSPAIAAVVMEDRRPVAFSITFAIAVAAGSLGGAIGGNMPGWCHSMGIHYLHVAVSEMNAKRITLLASCVITALAAWPIARWTKNSNHAPHSIAWISLPSPFLARFLLASFCWAAAVGAVNPFTSVFFVRYVGVATAHLGNFFAVAQLLQAAAVLAMPLLLRRTGLVAGIVTAQVCTAAAVSLLAAGRGVVTEEALYCAFMAAQHMCDPALQSLMMDRIPEDQRSCAAALYFLVISIAQAVAATVAGYAFQRFGYPPALVGVGVAAIGSGMAFRLLISPDSASSPLVTASASARV